eukprot:6482012-Amphidinium_carterae.2
MWMDKTSLRGPRAAGNAHDDARAAANRAIADEADADRATRLERIQQETRRHKQAAHLREFPLSNNLACPMLLVSADLREAQRETLCNAMYNKTWMSTV